MTAHTFTLRIMGPDDVDDPEVYAAILAERRPIDKTDDPATLRWLGTMTSEAEDLLNSLLPEGWYAKVEGGEVHA